MAERESPPDLGSIFNPKSIAVIGASNNPGKWGFIIPSNILNGGYKGKVYPVNPKETPILGLKTYKSLESIQAFVELALIVTPSHVIPSVMEECVECGVKSAIIITAGFSEAGEVKLEQEVIKIARRGNIRVVGPNTMGVFSSASSLCALMPPVRPLSGSVAFVSQSGNLGTQMLGWGQVLGIGFSKFVSSGNEADLRCEDYINYFCSDPSTNVILAYIEGLDDGKRFLEIARSVTPRKPIIVFKAGKTPAGARAAMSHCGALAGSRDVYDAVFKQAGIIQAATTEEMLDLAEAFTRLPLPEGRRVGILTWGGGWGVVTTDACVDMGLDVPPFQAN